MVFPACICGRNYPCWDLWWVGWRLWPGGCTCGTADSTDCLVGNGGYLQHSHSLTSNNSSQWQGSKNMRLQGPIPMHKTHRAERIALEQKSFKHNKFTLLYHAMCSQGSLRYGAG